MLTIALGAVLLTGFAVQDTGFAVQDQVQAESASPRAHNVLIVIADDLGVDRVQAYGYVNDRGTPIAPRTPNIDRLASQGVLFRNAWAAPGCSPSRAMAMTGKYPNRTGIGRFIPNRDATVSGMSTAEICLPSVLPDEYASAAFGKWHLASQGKKGGRTTGVDHSLRCGFDEFAGTMGNLETMHQDYWSYQWIRGESSDLKTCRPTHIEGEYVTSKTTNEALAVIRKCAETPWVLWVAYHAPHSPYHLPPAELIASRDLDATTHIGQGKATIEALDKEIGRLLEGIDPKVRARTTVIFFGDNGTHRDLVEPPFDPERAKATVYNGGVHVPLIVAGSILPESSVGEECAGLVDLTDLLPTVAEITGGIAPIGIDGHSFSPLLAAPHQQGPRTWIYSERFRPNFIPEEGKTIADFPMELHEQTARNDRYKLVRRRAFDQGKVTEDALELYLIETDIHEGLNLLDSEGLPPEDARESFEALSDLIQEMAS